MTTTLPQSAGTSPGGLAARPVGRAGGTRVAPPSARPPTPLPRTSTERPWDRVRFAGPVRRSTTQAETDAAVGLSSEPEGLPDPEQWAAALVRSAVEALLGLRPAAQLGRWLSQDLYEALARRAGLAVRVHGRSQVARGTVIRRVHVCPVREGVREATVVLHDGQKVRAAAVRLEVHRGRWRATALEIG